MNITLIRLNKSPVTVCVDKPGFAVGFSVDKGRVEHNESSRAGCEFMADAARTKELGMKHQPDAFKNYLEAFDLAVWAWENQVFDRIEDK